MTFTIVPDSLFSSGPRSDNGPAPYAWSAYRALDHSHFQRSAETRRELDDWFSRLPPKAATQIGGRFRDDNDVVHLGAFLELYVHELGLRMGAEVDIDVGNDEADSRRPGFLLRWGDWRSASRPPRSPETMSTLRATSTTSTSSTTRSTPSPRRGSSSASRCSSEESQHPHAGG